MDEGGSVSDGGDLPLLLQRIDDIAVVTLNRPKYGNAINVALADALLAVALECDADAKIRAVVLTAAGNMFCAGGDVGDFSTAQEEVPALVKRLTAPLHTAIARLLRMEKPLVTAINGAAAGAGLGLAVMGDVSLAARSAKFAAAYGGLGLSPDAGATWLVPRLVGLQQAKRLLLLGDRIDAPEAERIGLITRVVEDDQLASTMMEVAVQLAGSSRPAWRRTRDLLRDSFGADLEAQLEREAQAIARCSADPDAREGISAFIARRRPKFGTLAGS